MLTDDVALFTSAERARLRNYHRAILDAYDIDYRILTITSKINLNLHAAKAFKSLRVGALSDGKRGLLLMISPRESKVRLEVGRSLEGIYTDAFVSYIERRQLVPFFRAGRVADGVLATTELIASRATEAGAGREFEPPETARLEASVGGGATTSVDIGAGYQPLAGGAETIASDGSPIEIVNRYVDAMARGNADPNLSIYSIASRRMLADWVVTDAQMTSLAEAYAKCRVQDAKISADLAVVRYPFKQRQCAPFFFVREDGEWRLDLTVMTRLIRFNQRNSWRFPNGAGRFAFAFTDWRFDEHGFPY